MAVVPRRRKSGVVFYVKVTFDGREVWEHAGRERRQAERLNRQRLAELREGTYRPKDARTRPTFGQYAEDWLERRTGRNADSDQAIFREHVLSRQWLSALRLEQLDADGPRYMRQLVEELKASVSAKTGNTLSPKYVANIWGLVVTMCRSARIDGKLRADPCLLAPGTVQRRSKVKRRPYGVDAVTKLLRCPKVDPSARVFSGIAFLTGQRAGEVCGRRWRDLDRNTRPLWALTVDSQYDGQPLKGDRHEVGEVARVVPVHPELAALLDWWWSSGFEFVHLRPPTPDDFIVPNRDGSNHTHSSAYKMFRRALAAADVSNLTLHASRHTFITLARRGGGRKDVVERITHNAEGDTVDTYTHFDWAPLCEAVLCLSLGPEPGTAPLLPSGDATGDAGPQQSLKQAPAAGSDPGAPRDTSVHPAKLRSESIGLNPSAFPEELGGVDAERAARHHRPGNTPDRPAPPDFVLHPELIPHALNRGVPPSLLALAWAGGAS